MSETQTIISGLVVPGSTYLGDIYSDPGGAGIAMHSVRAANRYVGPVNQENQTPKKPKLERIKSAGKRVVDITSITYRTVSDTLHERPF
jgi:hypothetical protein